MRLFSIDITTHLLNRSTTVIWQTFILLIVMVMNSNAQTITNLTQVEPTNDYYVKLDWAITLANGCDCWDNDYFFVNVDQSPSNRYWEDAGRPHSVAPYSGQAIFGLDPGTQNLIVDAQGGSIGTDNFLQACDWPCVINTAFNNKSVSTSPFKNITNEQINISSGPSGEIASLSWIVETDIPETFYSLEIIKNGTVAFTTNSKAVVSWIDPDPLPFGECYEYDIRTWYKGGTANEQMVEKSLDGMTQFPSPSNMAGSYNSCSGGIDISWDYLTDPDLKFQIERSENNFVSGTIETFVVTPEVRSFSDMDLKLETQYWYRMSAFSSCVGQSNYTNIFSVQTPVKRIVYVKKGAAGLNNGLDWNNAFVTLGEAIDFASLCASIKEIHVAAGTYFPDEGPGRVNDDPSESFTMIKGVRINGGFPGLSGQENDFSFRDWRANPTILSGDIDQNDIGDAPNNIGNSYHVIFNQNNSVDGTSVLDGFTITRGNADMDPVSSRGGGMYNEGISPIVLNCDFIRNRGISGGAVYNLNCSSSIFVNSSFKGNRAAASGGALNSEGSTNFFTNCVFSGNSSDNAGGAIANLMSSATRIDNSTFARNLGTSSGTIQNLNNSTVLLQNSILFDTDSNNPVPYVQSITNLSGATTDIKNSLVEHSGGSDNWNSSFGNDQGANLDTDPFFVSIPSFSPSTLGDVRLKLYSPAIDVGNNTLLPIDLHDIDNNSVTIETIPIDITGLMRTEGGRVDLGAYEYPCDFRLRTTSTLEPYPLSRTVICEGSNAVLVLQNVGATQEVVWFKDSLLENQVFVSSQNLFEPTISSDTIFWGVIRESSDINTLCPSNPLKVDITHYTCIEELDAFQDDNDAYIDITWNIDKVNPAPPAPDGVFMELLADGVEIYRETRTQTESNTIILFDDVFRHHVGPDKTINYTLNIYKIGLGELLHQQLVTGSTTSQRIPVLTADQEVHPGKVELNWDNESKLPVETNIYRDDLLIATLFSSDNLSTSYSYIDSFATVGNSLINGILYNYCIEPHYVPLNTSYERSCNNGSTIDIGLSATDYAYESKVVLTWNDIASFGSQLEIWSDDNLLERIPNTTTTYTAYNVVPGKNINYKVRLLKENQIISEDNDFGIVEANGFISGRIITKTGDFAVGGVALHLEGVLLDSLVLDTVYTDVNGYYQFEKVYYGQQSEISITPYRTGFSYNPLTKEVPLSVTSFEEKNINFSQNEGYIDEGPMIGNEVSISDIRVLPQGQSNAILFEIDYTSNGGIDSVFLNVKRGAQILDVQLQKSGNGTFQYIDSTGIPSAQYDYNFLIYSYVQLPSVAGINVFKSSQIESVTYPVVFPLATFEALPDVTQGYVSLSWTQPAVNYEGFKLRRSGKLIAILPASFSGQYVDEGGLPGINYNYSISAFRTVEEVDYESEFMQENSILYPDLPAPGNFVAVSGADEVVLTWTVAPPANAINRLSVDPLDAEYNFTGFQLYRDDDLIGVVYRSFPFEFKDWGGVPKQSYNYKIRAFKETIESISYSPFVSIAHVFPVVSPPGSLLASDGTKDFSVQLDWQAPASISNIGGFILYKGSDSIITVPSGLTTSVIEASHANSIDYGIRSFRIVNGQLYQSELLSDGGMPNVPYASSLPAIENFKASDDLTQQVVLTWEYPDFILADFQVYRNSVLIGTVNPPNRKYCDTTVVGGAAYLYQLKAVVLTDQSNIVLDYGSAVSGQHLYGHALSIPSNVGISHVRVSAAATDYREWTLTDSTGYYEFDNIPLKLNGSLIVSAAASGVEFIQDVKQINASELDDYIVDFQSNYERPIADDISPAQVDKLTLDRLPCLNGIRVGWTASNNNYDGFELYRGVKKIAVIEKGNLLEFVDTDYIPGILQSYQIRAYLLGEDRTNYTGYLANAIIAPALQPVAHFEAVDIVGGNGLDLYWSHPCDKHSSYKILRNGEIVALIATGKPMVIRDSTGVPGALYSYSISAILNSKGLVFESEPVLLSINYPTVQRVDNFQVVSPFVSNVDIRYVPVEVAGTYYQNYTHMTWEYNSEYCDTINIYRDGGLIASLDCDVRVYDDSIGIPEQQHIYGVGVALSREGTLVEAERQNVSINYPKLERPNSVSGMSRIVEGDFRLQFKYPSDNISGFKIYRGPSEGDLHEIGMVSEYTHGDSFNEYLDRTGVPGVSYFYAIEAFTERVEVEYSSRLVFLEPSSPYPYPAAPKTLVASDWNRSISLNSAAYFQTDLMSFNVITVSWQYDIEEPIAGFELERRDAGINGGSWAKIADIDRGQRNYIDIDNNGYTHSSRDGYDYRVRTKKIINNVIYYSPYSNVDNGTARVDEQDYCNFPSGEVCIGSITIGGVTTEYYTEYPSDFVMTASDGLYSGYTELNWSFLGSANQFEIYRDGELIRTITDGTTRIYTDGDGIPSKKSVYSVRFIGGDFPNYVGADIGYRKGGGAIYGYVRTLLGNAPVPGTNVTATGFVDGNYNIVEASTNSLGEFFIDDLLAIGNVTQYSLEVVFEDHVFLENPIVRTLPASQTTAIRDVIFLDKTAYVVSGKVIRPNVTCALEGVSVRSISIFNDGNKLVEDTKTDKNGNYSLVVNPQQEGLDEINISILPYSIEGEANNADTTFYNFVPLSDTIFTTSELLNLPVSNIINYEETTTYPVELIVQTACNLPVSEAGFSIRIEDVDGCYSEVFKTNAVGKVTANLPPLNYSFRIEDVDNSSSRNLLALDYFRFRPNALNLENVALENVDLNSVAFQELIKQEFVYHKSPTIRIVSGFDYLCDDPNNPANTVQGNSYSIDFNVTESHEGNICSVSEGYLKITSSASTDGSPRIMQYDKDEGRFPLYTYVAGSPNRVAPHVQSITVEYFSENGSFQGALSKSVFISGTAPIPGNDVIVLADTLGGVVQMPMYILRDPPGDGSFSTISAGTTIKRSIQENVSHKGQAGLHYEGETNFAAVGIFVNANVKAGGGESSTDSWEYSVTLNQDISTSAGDTGQDADIIVGMGMAMQYGLQQEISIDPDDCSIIRSKQIQGFGPGEISTTWFYTYKQIQGFVDEADRIIIEIDAGERDLKDASGQVIDPAIAKIRYEVYRDSWKKVLEYHSVNTLPWYNLCSQDYQFPSNSNGNKRKSETDTWLCEFCPKVVEGYNCTDGSFTGPKSNILWDQTLIDIYNKASTSIRNLTADPDAPLDPKWYYDQNKIDIANSYNDVAYNSLYGAGAENITFGSGVNVSRSFKSASAGSRSHTNSIYFDGDVVFGLSWEAKTNLGFILSQEIIKIQGKFGAIVEYSYEESETHAYAQENTVEIGYTLADDDTEGIGDQYSVTVIQGPTHNHTPYFELVGGRTSCPVEDGAITRDLVDINLFDINIGQPLASPQSQYNVDPDGVATYYLQLTNLNPFGETQRDFKVFLDNQSNQNGAFVRLGSALLGNQIFYDVAPGPNNSLVIPLTIQRGYIGYQHDGIRIGIIPYCVDGTTDEFAGAPEYITINTRFRTPCTNVTLVEPDNNWVIKSRDIFSGDRDELRMGVIDYNPSNENFKDMRFEYRRLGTGEAWITMLNKEDANEFKVTRDSLADFNEIFLAGVVPKYYFTWDITNLTIPDGEYEIRAVALCESIQVETYSNIVTGTIDRANIRLFGSPQPSDKIWTSGDEISVRYNKNIDCSIFENQAFVDTRFFLTNKSTGQAVPATITCNNNELIILTNQPMSNFDGDTLEALVINVSDISGNVADSIEWSFIVITHPLYWGDQEIFVEIYRGTQIIKNISLFNTGQNLVNAQINNTGGVNSWLEFSNNVDVPIIGYSLPLTFDARSLAVGEYADTLEIDVQGQVRKPQLKINLTVVAEAPNWVVNTSDFSSDMSVTANYKFKTENVTSTDQLDLISVWINGTLRSVSNVEKVGDFHAAYLAVLGNTEDVGGHLKFRVWDASKGIEYDAFPADSIFYVINSIEGSTSAPIELIVDKKVDQARYIPLNKGWTWFSINVSRESYNIRDWLSSLTKVSSGDIIKTRDKFAQYTNAGTWIFQGVTGLEDLSTEDGYMINLENGPDTLRITGVASGASNQQLTDGWNWIGYPLQQTQALNNAIKVSNIVDGDIIKTTRQNGTSLFASYEDPNWSGSLTEMRPYDAYKLLIDDPIGGVLFFNDLSAPFQDDKNIFKNNTVTGNPADTTDASTWIMANQSYELNMPLIAEIRYGGSVVTDPMDRLALFVGDDLRGVANVELASGINKHLATLLVKGVSDQENYLVYYYNAVQNRVFKVDVELSQDDKGYGTFDVPYLIQIGLFSVDVSKKDVNCQEDESGFIELHTLNAVAPIYKWSHDENASGSRVEGLSAGMYIVSITDNRNIEDVRTFEIINIQSMIAKPIVTGGENEICPGTPMTLSASSSVTGVTYEWLMADGSNIGSESTALITDLKQSETIKVRVLENGVCPSDYLEVPLKVIIDKLENFDELIIVGPQIICPGLQDVGYSINIGDDLSDVDWSFVGADGTITETSMGASLDLATAFAGGELSVEATDVCNSLSATIPITIANSFICRMFSNCPDNTNITNALLESTGAPQIYRAGINLASDAELEIYNYEFTAGTSLSFESGFSIASGLNFVADIKKCNK
ncbi:MAG: hypothetical protein ACJA01_002595 [Saprospiraceae bacterium]|jgi:hypothetical protein